MNLLLIEPLERIEPGLACVRGRKARHLRRVLGKAKGDAVRVGELDGRIGEGTIELVETDAVWVRYLATEPPPLPSPVDLVLALPRPPMLRRILQAVTSLGVKRIVLLHAARVEKSFWDSHSMAPAELDAQLRLGLEQARDTVLPAVSLQRRFLPFVQDDLPGWAGQGRRLLGHPRLGAEAPQPSREPSTVAIGPEGGWVPFEVEQFESAGFRCVSLGPRTLRVETAVVALLARLGPV